MVSLRALVSAPALLCLLGACTIKSATWDESGSTQAEAADGNAAGGGPQTNLTNGAGAKSGAHAGAAGRAGVKTGANAAGGSAGETDTDSDSDSASAGSNSADTDPPPPCDLNGNCSSKCEDDVVTCGVNSDNECEFRGFAGATVPTSCGTRVVVGTACCGGCGCVQIEVYFDGVSCWQGMPQCGGQLFRPHPPTSPNPSFTPSTDVMGIFQLGSGGVGGATGTAGTGGSAPSAAAGETNGPQGEGGAPD